MKAQKESFYSPTDNQRVTVKAGESRKKAEVSPQPVGKQEETRAVKEVKVKNAKLYVGMHKKDGHLFFTDDHLFPKHPDVFLKRLGVFKKHHGVLKKRRGV